MVFSCKKCQSRYRIDEKLFERKAIRFACRKCGQVHLLKDPVLGGESVVALEAEAAPSHAAQARPARGMPPPAGTPYAAGTPHAAGMPPTRPTMGTTALPAIPTRKTVDFQSAFAHEAPAAERAPRPEDLWFAIRKGQRIGPFFAAGLLEQLGQGVLHERSFVWRPTMESWTRMNQVPQLAAMLAQHREFLAAQAQERTVMAPPPAAAPPAPPAHPAHPAHPAPPGHHVPPVPEDASRPSEVSGRGLKRRDGRPSDGLVDGLYEDVSQPALDLRRAEEVQEEEPPALPPPVPAPRPSARTHPAAPPARPPEPPRAPARPAPPVRPEPRAPGPRLPAAPARPEPPARAPVRPEREERPVVGDRPTVRSRPVEPEPLFPTSAPEPHAAPAPDHLPMTDGEAENRFFARPVMMPQQDWPHAPGVPHPSGEIAWPAGRPGEPGAISLPSRPPQHPSMPSQNLQEFSLLIRLGKKSRRNVLVALAAVGGLLILAIGVAVGYTVLQPGPKRFAVTEDEPAAIPAAAVAAPRPAPAPRIEAPPDREWILPRGGARPRAAGDPQPGTNGNGVPVTPPPPKKEEKLAPVDPTVRHEFDRFGALLADGGDKQEVKVDVKPRTLTEMPKQTMSKAGMDAFMNTKMRKFSECKGRMSRPTDMPVKIGLSFNVDSEGRVDDVVVDQSGRRDEGLDSCVRRIVTSWAFPPPEEATTFRTTLLL